MKNFAPGFGARHGHEFLRPVQAHGIMSQCTKMAEIPTGSTTQIKDGVRRIALNRVQERCVVLADIVIPSAIPERVGQPIVMGDGNRGKPSQLPAADQRWLRGSFIHPLTHAHCSCACREPHHGLSPV
jgi:hypothetical protein